MALEAMGQTLGAGHQAGFATFAQDVQGDAVGMALDRSGGEAQGLGNAQPGLEEGKDQELVPEPVASLAGGRYAGHFLPGEVGDETQGLGDQDLGDERAISHRIILDKTNFGPILLPAAGQSQGKE
jgi:hypothetical protein